MSLPSLLPHLYFFCKIQNKQPTTHNFRFVYNSLKKKNHMFLSMYVEKSSPWMKNFHEI